MPIEEKPAKSVNPCSLVTTSPDEAKRSAVYVIWEIAPVSTCGLVVCFATAVTVKISEVREREAAKSGLCNLCNLWPMMPPTLLQASTIWWYSSSCLSCYPRGTRSVTVTSLMTSPLPSARAIQYVAHNLCSSPFERRAPSHQQSYINLSQRHR